MDIYVIYACRLVINTTAVKCSRTKCYADMCFYFSCANICGGFLYGLVTRMSSTMAGSFGNPVNSVRDRASVPQCHQPKTSPGFFILVIPGEDHDVLWWFNCMSLLTDGTQYILVCSLILHWFLDQMFFFFKK